MNNIIKKLMITAIAVRLILAKSPAMNKSLWG